MLMFMWPYRTSFARRGFTGSLGLFSCADAGVVTRSASRVGLCGLQEPDQVVLPDGGHGVGAVAAGRVGDGDEDEACLGIRLTIFSAMPSSGGLMKSSAELIHSTGT